MDKPGFEKLLQEAVFKATTSGGKGGQNVNKVATKIELYFDINASSVLTNDEKTLIHAKLCNRISNDGILRITGTEKRTQLANKDLVKDKFLDLIRKALTPKKKRRQTAPSKNSVEERIRKKKLLSEKKRLRTRADH